MTIYATNRQFEAAFWTTGVVSVLCLPSCRDEDRSLTVTCGQPPGKSISVQMGGADGGLENVGLLTAQQFAPGTILLLTPSATNADAWHTRAAYVLQTTEGEFLPLRPEPWFSNVVAAHFGVEMDEDTERDLKPLKLDWNALVTKNLAVVFGGVYRRVLRDPAALINADKAAVDIVRSESSVRRFVIVNAVSYADGVGVIGLNYSSRPNIAINTLEVSKFYLHEQFSCSTLKTLNIEAKSSGTKVPVVSFYLNLTYDRSTGTIGIDGAPVDLMALNLDGDLPR